MYIYVVLRLLFLEGAEHGGTYIRIKISLSSTVNIADIFLTSSPFPPQSWV